MADRELVGWCEVCSEPILSGDLGAVISNTYALCRRHADRLEDFKTETDRDLEMEIDIAEGYEG